MKKTAKGPVIIDSISKIHRLLGLPKPVHPLVSVIRLENIDLENYAGRGSFVQNFYAVTIKKGFKGKMRYGQQYYDFDEGILSFFAPGQVFGEISPEDRPPAGWTLFIHPDFLRNYPLGAKIGKFGFFSYELHEALHLSDQEEQMIERVVGSIEKEYFSAMDLYSQDVIIAHIEVLLNYGNRFYNRQFITRKQAGNDLLTKVEDLLEQCFDSEAIQQAGIPTVQYIAERLNLSPSYLSDMLRAVTGQNTQQHIHNHLIEKAKYILTASSLTVSEVAYRLGFEYPQYFSKLFKSKTNFTPLKYRQNFN